MERANMNNLENLIIEGTSSSPSVFFETNGHLHISGRSMPDNPSKAFEPLFVWLEQLEVNTILFDIQLDYLNTSSSLQLFTLLRMIDESEIFEKCTVNWHYEADDEDALESGQIFEDFLIKAEFRYHEYSEAA